MPADDDAPPMPAAPGMEVSGGVSRAGVSSDTLESGTSTGTISLVPSTKGVPTGSALNPCDVQASLLRETWLSPKAKPTKPPKDVFVKHVTPKDVSTKEVIPIHVTDAVPLRLSEVRRLARKAELRLAAAKGAKPAKPRHFADILDAGGGVKTLAQHSEAQTSPR